MAFANYMKENHDEIYTAYYSLENQEKIVYIQVVNLFLKVIMIAIIIMGVISSINSIQASLTERKQEFDTASGKRTRSSCSCESWLRK